jgi:hypothetical protein
VAWHNNISFYLQLPKRPIFSKPDTIMPYHQEEVVAALTDYYHFLTSLHIDPADIKTPPPSGWPTITSETCNKLSQTDAVISLLKHLPYITNEDNFLPTLLWWLSGCNDYTYHEFQTGHTGIPESIDLENCQWKKLREAESRAQFVHLANPAVGQSMLSLASQEHNADTARSRSTATI